MFTNNALQLDNFASGAIHADMLHGTDTSMMTSTASAMMTSTASSMMTSTASSMMTSTASAMMTSTASAMMTSTATPAVARDACALDDLCAKLSGLHTSLMTSTAEI